MGKKNKVGVSEETGTLKEKAPKGQKDQGKASSQGLRNGTMSRSDARNGNRSRARRTLKGPSLVNGKGLTNGNGLTNGGALINGTGLVNGKALVNGNVVSARGTGRPWRSRTNIKIIGVAVVFALLMLLVPIASMFMVNDNQPIIIDGQFDDWSDISGEQDPIGDTDGGSSIDLRMVRLHRWNRKLAFQIEVNGEIFTGDRNDNMLATIFILLDSDRDPSTGYRSDGIGADWMIDISGMDGKVNGVTLHKFDQNRSLQDWNGWVHFSSGNAQANGDGVEGIVSLDISEDPIARVYSYDPHKQMDRLDKAISTGPLVSTTLTPQDMTDSDTLIGTVTGKGSMKSIALQEAIYHSPGTTRSYWITAEVETKGSSIGVHEVVPSLTDGDIPIVLERLHPAEGWERKVTIGTSGEIIIDGAFADWSRFPAIARITMDPEKDVIGGDDPDLDLLETAEVLKDPAFYFSTRVRGTSLAGTPIPFEPRTGPVIKPITGPSGPSTPPPAPKPRLGTDRTEVFIDINSGKGYHSEWMPFNAKYMVVIEGRDGDVISSTLMRFSGKDPGQWVWEEVGAIQAATGGSRLEAEVPRTLIPDLTGSYNTFFRTTDWENKLEDTGGHAIHALLQFAMASFDPLEGLPSLPSDYIVTEPTGYYIVQFNTSITEELREEVEALGARTLDYIPTYGMVVHLPTKDPSSIEGLPHVRWVGLHQPAFRVDPSLLDRSGEVQIIISLYEGAMGIAPLIDRICTDINWSSATVLEANVDVEHISEVAHIPEVKFISPKASREIHNDVQRGITWSDPPAEIFGLTGKGQIIAIADTGLDTGNDTDHQPDHPDVCGRVIAWFDVVKELWPAGCLGDCTDDQHAHGTHVAGTAVGGGNASNGELRGVAPEAEIVFQALNDDNGQNGAFIVYNDLHKLYADAYDEGARVHQNSWGSTINQGDYTAHSQQTDDWNWGNKSMLIVFSAGNDGEDGDNTTTPPATAKNTLTVAASENYRPTISSSGNDVDTLASFSSRGYTHDSRIKPDITAPGTWILSGRSSVGGGGWGSYSTYYQFMGGTSMAAPHVSGAAILVRQYYTDYEEITPSAALMKATMINGADDMGSADIPNKNEGWGRLNLTNSLFPEQPRLMRYVDNNTGFSSGDPADVYNYTIGDKQLPLKISLVWTDYPGSIVTAQTAAKLVNNLDLEVTFPNGTVYKGNDFDSGWTTTGGDADDRNNVENVYYKTPPAGTYSIKVKPTTITQGPQPFAIVVSGELVPDLNITSITTDPASPGPGDDITLKAKLENHGSEDLPPLFRHSLSSLSPGVTENLTDVAFSHDGDFALIVGNNRTVLRYETSNGAISTLDTTTVPWTNFTAVAFNPNGHEGNRTIPEALLVGTNGTIVAYRCRR